MRVSQAVTHGHDALNVPDPLHDLVTETTRVVMTSLTVGSIVNTSSWRFASVAEDRHL